MLQTLRRNFRWSVCLIGCIALGCASMGARRAQEAPATTQASASPRKLSIADGKPIAQFREGEREIDLRNRISYEGGNDVYFGQADTYDGDDVKATLPLIVASVKGSWLALSVADPRLADAEWQFIASGPAAGEIWGVLDDSLNHKAKVLLLAHSADYGKNWSVASVAKPFGAGDYDSFCMDKTGHGRLSVYIALDGKHPHRAGYYHLRTTDAAKTWSAPEHEPDALDPAEDIPEDEDVAPLKEAPTQNARLNGERSKKAVVAHVASASIEAHP